MPSPFVAAAEAAYRDPNTAPVIRDGLLVLLAHAVGRSNAITGAVIVKEMQSLGYAGFTKEDFQKQVVRETRANGIFIASCYKGFFLIDSQEDAQRMVTFYANRIKSEQINQSKLVELASLEGWHLDTTPDELNEDSPDAGA